MAKYILKRVLILIPTLFAMMVISFMISSSPPGDPVEMEIAGLLSRPGTSISKEDREKEYRRISEKLGQNKPTFYFTLTSNAYPDTLHRILYLRERESLAKLVNSYGNWPEISDYYHATVQLEAKAYDLQPPADIKYDVDEVKIALKELKGSPEKSDIFYRLDLVDSLCKTHSGFLGEIGKGATEIRQKFATVESNATHWKLYVPAFRLNGWKNQFHHWMVRMLTLDFGTSYEDKMPVATKIKHALPWTFFMGLVSFILAYLIAIPIGVHSVRKRNTSQDRVLTIFIFLLHSIPSFVMAIVLITLLCNPDYLYIFPTSGVVSDGAETWSFWAQLKDSAWHLTLPTLAYTYGSIAFLSRQMRAGMIETINQDYIRTARAKGLSEHTVIWKHALRNSILPILTHFSSLLPHLVGGAIIIESIFSIPGMGRLTFKAATIADHPTVMAVFTIGAILSVLGILMADILYAIADPRISFSKR